MNGITTGVAVPDSNSILQGVLLTQIRHNLGERADETLRLVHENQLLHNTRYMTLYNDTIINEMQAKTARIMTNKEIVITQSLTITEQSEMQQMFGHKYRLNMINRDCGQHAFYAALRVILNQLCYDMIGYDSYAKSHPDGIFLKDVGGNPLTMVVNGRVHNHCCCPIGPFQKISFSNAEDLNRHSRYLSFLSTYVAKSKKELEIMKQILTKDKRRICNNLAQHCNRKCEFMMFTHSTYNNSASDIADMMQSSGASVAVGTFHLPKALYSIVDGSNDYGLRWKIYTHRNIHYIRFNFAGDYQRSYVHRLDLYMALVRSAVITTTDKKNSYMINLEQNYFDVQVFRIYRLMSPQITPSYLNTQIPFCDKKITVIHYYAVNTRSVRYGKIHPIVIHMNTDMFRRLFGYLLTVPEGKFNIQNALSLLNSLCSRVSVNGTNLVFPQPLSPEDLVNAAHAVYFLVWRARYDAALVLKAIMEDEQMHRKCPRGLLTFIMNLIFGGIDKHHPIPVHDMDDFMQNIAQTVQMHEDFSDLKKMNTFCYRTAVLYHRQRKFYVDHYPITSTMSVSQHINLIANAVDEKKKIDLLDPMTSYLANMVENLTDATVPSQLDYATHCLTPRFPMKELLLGSNNHQCMFVALANMAGIASPAKMKMQLLNSVHLRQSIFTDREVTDMKLTLTSEALPADTNIFRLWALHYNKNLCLHTGVQYRHMMINDVAVHGVDFHETLHISVEECHCTVLIPDVSALLPTPPCDVEFVTNLDEMPTAYSYSSHVSLAQLELLDITRRNMDYAVKAVNPLHISASEVNLIARFGLELLFLDHKYDIVQEGYTLDVGASPGSYIQVVRSKFPSNVVIAIDSRPLDSDIADEISYFNFGTDGDLLNQNSVNTIYSSMLNCGMQFTNLFFDVLDSNDDCGGEYNVKLRVFLSLALEVAAIGSNWVIRIDCTKPIFIKLLAVMNTAFEHIYCVKTPFANPFDHVIHVLGVCYLGDIDVGYYTDLLGEDANYRYGYGLSTYARLVNHTVDNYINEKTDQTLKEYIAPTHVFRDDIIKAFKIRNCTMDPMVINTHYVAHDLEADVSRRRTSTIPEADTRAITRNDRVHYDFVENMLLILEQLASNRYTDTERGMQLITDYTEGTYFPDFTLPTMRHYHYKLRASYVMAVTVDGHDIVIPIQSFTLLLRQVLTHLESKKLRLKLLILSSVLLDLPSEEQQLCNKFLRELTVKGHANQFIKIVMDTSYLIEPSVIPQSMKDSFLEFLTYTEKVHTTHMDVHRSAWNAYVIPYMNNNRRQAEGILRNHNYIFSIVKKVSGQMHYLSSNPSRHQNYDYVYAMDHGFLKFTDLPENAVALVSETTKHYSYDRILPNLCDIDTDSVVVAPRVVLYQGVAGHGKTRHIVNEADVVMTGDKYKLTLILTQTNEGRDDMIKRIAEHKGIDAERIDRTYVRTVNSFIKQPVRDVNVVYIDEAMMNHTGAIVAISLMSRARLVKCYGDIVQLPFCSKLPNFVFGHNRMSDVFSVENIFNESHRIPKSVALSLADEYLDAHDALGSRVPIKTWSMETGTYEIKIISSLSEMDRTLPDNVILTFTMNDKNLLRESGIFASTIASFQGKQSRNVTIFRSSTNQTDPIFNDVSMIVTAMTRHTHKLRYYTYLRNGVDRLQKKMSEHYSPEQLRSVSAGNHIGSMVSNGFAVCEEQFFPDYTCVGDGTTSLNYVNKILPDDHVVVMREHNAVRTRVGPVGGVEAHPLYGVGVYSIVNYLKKNRLTSVVFRKHDIRTYKVGISELSRLLKKAGLRVDIKIYDKNRDDACRRRRGDLADTFMLNNAFGSHNVDLPEVDKYVDVTRDERTTNQVTPDVTYLQYVLDLKFGSDVLFDYSHDNYMLHHFDIEYTLPPMSLDVSRDLYKPELYDCLRPVLKSPVPQLRVNSQRELVLATMKRNFKRPMLQDCVVDEEVVAEMMNNLDSLFIDGYASVASHLPPIDINKLQLVDWLSGQSESVYSALEQDVDIFHSDLTRLKTMIKRFPKTDIAGYDRSVIQTLQTINCQSKQLNAFFCVLMRQVKDRMYKLLKREVMIYSDCSPSEYSDRLSTVFKPGDRSSVYMFSGDDSWISINGDSIEIDISKFDQSQGRYVLLFECEFFRLMGVPEEYCRIWYLSHIERNVSSTELGVKYHMGPQRNSGDAWTFGGNTSFLMAVVACCIDMRNKSGIVYTPLFDKFRSMFNLEVKHYRYSVPYFCSKFLVSIDESSFRFIPCPLKMLVKLGRRDIRNFDHLEEIRQSLIDLTAEYNKLELCAVLDFAFEERYHITIDTSTLLGTLYHLVRDAKAFGDLFYTDPGDHLDTSCNWAKDR